MKPLAVPGASAEMSPLVLGTMTFGDTLSAHEATRMFEAALEAGITGVDTANGYAGGMTESLLAPMIAAHRNRIVLATKAGMPHPDAGEDSPLSARGLRRSVEGSLGRLGVEVIDIFYLHQPDRAASLHETLETVAELVEEGKIRALGVSNFAAWQIGDLMAACDDLGAPRPVVAQQLYNLVARRVEEEYTEFAEGHGLSTMVYNPLGGGLLTGRHTFSDRPEAGRFGDSRLAGMYTQRYWNEQLFFAIDRLTGIAREAGISLIELSLRWLASNEAVDQILLGGSKVSQVTENIALLAKGPLTPEIVTACDEVGYALRGPMPAYNR